MGKEALKTREEMEVVARKHEIARQKKVRSHQWSRWRGQPQGRREHLVAGQRKRDVMRFLDWPCPANYGPFVNGCGFDRWSRALEDT